MTDYPNPPRPENADGEPRRIGVEIEFGGLSVPKSVVVAREALGGEVEKRGQHLQILHVEGLGALEFELDMAPRHVEAFAEKEDDDDPLRAITGEVVNWLAPVELVAPPLPLADLPRLDPLLKALRRAGATGTSHGVQTAYGMHLNVEAASLDVAGLLPVLRAFALLEDWLRDRLDISANRRLSGFVKPYPREYVDLLARADYVPDQGRLFSDYLRLNPTRNRALDLTPIIEMIDPDRAKRALGDEKRSARPTFHYRLPDAHVDRPDWSPRRDWALWRLVERAAADRALLEALAHGWEDHRAAWTSSRSDWGLRCEDMLRAAGLIARGGSLAP